MHTTTTELPPARHKPAIEPDQLGVALTRHLSRNYHNAYSISPTYAAILGLLTLGIGPLLRMRSLFRLYIMSERQQLHYFAELLRMRGHETDAAEIEGVTKKLRCRTGLHILQALCIAAVVVAYFAFTPGHYFDIDRILASTFRFFRLTPAQRTPEILIVFLAWNVGLVIAYTLHWLHVSLHQNAVRRALAKYNLPKDRPADFDLRWYVVGMILAAFGGFWAMWMALAGEFQRRYINVTAHKARLAMLQRMRETDNSGSGNGSNNYTLHRRRCDNPQCRAYLPEAASFCPRCGARV